MSDGVTDDTADTIADPDGARMLCLLMDGKDDEAVVGFEGFFASRALERGADGETWLHVAAGHACLKACQWLVAHGADVNDPGINEEFRVPSSPLGEAVTCGSLRIAKLLLEHGAFVDNPPSHYISPLMIASLYGHFDIAKTLIEHGAEINRQHGRWTRTALDIAEIYGHPDIAELLRVHGGIRLESDRRDWQGAVGQALIEHIEQNGLSAVEEDSDGDSQSFVLNLRFAGRYYDKEPGTCCGIPLERRSDGFFIHLQATLATT